MCMCVCACVVLPSNTQSFYLDKQDSGLSYIYTQTLPSFSPYLVLYWAPGTR